MWGARESMQTQREGMLPNGSLFGGRLGAFEHFFIKRIDGGQSLTHVRPHVIEDDLRVFFWNGLVKVIVWREELPNVTTSVDPLLQCILQIRWLLVLTSHRAQEDKVSLNLRGDHWPAIALGPPDKLAVRVDPADQKKRTLAQLLDVGGILAAHRRVSLGQPPTGPCLEWLVRGDFFQQLL